VLILKRQQYSLLAVAGASTAQSCSGSPWPLQSNAHNTEATVTIAAEANVASVLQEGRAYRLQHAVPMGAPLVSMKWDPTWMLVCVHRHM
jgi:hypothetical protein